MRTRTDDWRKRAARDAKEREFADREDELHKAVVCEGTVEHLAHEHGREVGADAAPAIKTVQHRFPRKTVNVIAPPGRFSHARDLVLPYIIVVVSPNGDEKGPLRRARALAPAPGDGRWYSDALAPGHHKRTGN
jgi:hypothetical protein